MHRTALHTVHMQKHRHDVTQHHQVNKHTHEDVERGKMPLYYRCVELTCFFIKLNEKSAQRRRKHCAMAVVRRSQKISPRRRPLPGGMGRPTFNQLEMVTTFTYKPSLVRIDARNFELLWQQTHAPTNTPTHPATHKQTGPITIHCTTS